MNSETLARETQERAFERWGGISQAGDAHDRATELPVPNGDAQERAGDTGIRDWQMRERATDVYARGPQTRDRAGDAWVGGQARIFSSIRSSRRCRGCCT